MAFLRIVETLGELEDGRFAGARWADQGDRLARRDGEAEFVQRTDVRPGRVAKADLVELPCSPSRFDNRGRLRLASLRSPGILKGCGLRGRNLRHNRIVHAYVQDSIF